MISASPLKMTKNCIAPWQMLEVCVDGTIRPCSGPIEGNYGNITNALSEPSRFRDAFNSEAHQQLRRQLLAGELQDACITCRCVPEQSIPIEVLRYFVEFHLRSRGRDISKSTDLCTEFAFDICNTGITDKCNFSCIYCFTHSNDGSGEGIKNYCATDHDRFIQLIALLIANGLKVLHLCGGGELTTYHTWRELCTTLFDTYPQLYISLVSNFGKKFSDADLDVLLRFCQITISCDTIDPELYTWLRRGGRIEVLLDNIAKLKSRMSITSGSKPSLILNVTESSVIIDKLVDLAKYAADHDLKLQFSNLLVVKGSFADTYSCLTKIVDISDDRIPPAWEILCDLPERLQAQKPNGNNCLLFGPLYEIVRQKAEAMSFNRFVPSADEIFYTSFAVLHPRNQKAFLRKIFRSFHDCHRGIFIAAGTTIHLTVPFATGRLTYRTIWSHDNSAFMFTDATEEITVGQNISISTVITFDFFSHMLFEVVSYEPDHKSYDTVEALTFSEPTVHFTPEYRTARVHNDLGELYLKLGNIQNYRQHLEMAVLLQPSTISYQKKLADLLSTHLGDIQGALRIYTRLHANAPNDVEVLKGIARIGPDVGQTSQARNILIQVLMLQPHDSEALEALRVMES